MADDWNSSVGRGACRVAVVIVNFRTTELTTTAVRSVLDDPLVEEIVVVDNGSGDGGADALRASFSEPPVRVVESPVNLGFGQGVNLGVESCQAPLVFFLNSDAAVRPGALALLVRSLLADDTVGVVAPAVYQADGRLQEPAYGPLPRAGAVLRVNQRRVAASDLSPGWVSGVAMLLRRTDFVAIGGFDPEFAMYLEDVDLCRRLLSIGRRTAREPAAEVVHLLAQSNRSRVGRVEQFQHSKTVYLRKIGATPGQLRRAAVLRWARLTWERLRPAPRSNAADG